MTNRDFVKFIFENENKIRYAVYEKRNDNCVPKTGGNNGHSRISDPTAQKAMQRVMPIFCVSIEYGVACNGKRDFVKIYHPESWLKVIAETYRYYDKKKQGELLYSKYRLNESRLETCKKLGVKKSWYTVMLNDCIRHAETLADGKGIFLKKGML